MDQKKIELLAPAGSMEGFEAALGAGADAVYAGGDLFGARAYAQNFSREELLQAIDTAHIHGKKLYLTVNTLLKNRELREILPEYLAPFYEAGLDAVLVQDPGVLQVIRREFPELPIHASTQMTVTGPAGMRFLETLGVSRVVAARELSLRELSLMHQSTAGEIEAFVHGALCYSYSGQCLMSSIFGGRSGNRGRCAQPCRLPYQASLSGKEFKGDGRLCPLSLKDICAIEILPQILEAGVTSLKIEGRMKQPGYTAGVTAIYRKYLDLLLEKGPETYQVEEADKKYLRDLFNRGGFCKGYYQMQNGPEMMAFSNDKKTGEAPAEIRKRKEKIHGNLILFPGSPVILEVSCRGKRASASLGEVQYATSRPLEEERIRTQMEKLGNTPFLWERLDIQTDGSIFVPVKTLNEVRRQALDALTKELLLPYRRRYAPEKEHALRTEWNAESGAGAETEAPAKESSGFSKSTDLPAKEKSRLPVYVSCEEKRTARSLLKEEGLTGMYLPFDAMKECLQEGLSLGLEMYLALPYITRGEAPEGFWETAEEWLSCGMKGFLVRNLESFAMLKERGLEKYCVTDHTLYVWNDEAADFWRKQGTLRHTLPLELNGGELRHREHAGGELLVYGYLPLMQSAQCVRKNLFGCSKKEDTVFLKDRYGKSFPVSCFCDPWKAGNTGAGNPCYTIIYNTIPFGLLKEKTQVEDLAPASVRLSFTVEKPEEAAGILRDFMNVYRKGKKAPQREFTKGHFKRGAE